jgi:hypothetical protein
MEVSPRGVYQNHLPELKRLMKQGMGKTGPLPDNQRFNESQFLKVPRGLQAPGN